MSYYSNFAHSNASYRRAQAAYDAQEPPVGRWDHLDGLDTEDLQARLDALCIADEYGELDEEIALIKSMLVED